MTTMAQANMLPSGSEKPQKSRQRASVACAACRERRTRCAILPGESECTQCRAIGCQCVIRYDDERRKPNSRAYINSLNERIAALETALKDKEQSTASASAVTNAPSDASSSPNQVSGSLQSVSEHDSGSTRHVGDTVEAVTDSDATDGYSPHSTVGVAGHESMVSKLLSTTGHLSFDQLSGRLRYFGPTTNCHVHSDLHPQSEQINKQALEQQRRTLRIISTLSQETHDYLMEEFWQHYNSVIHVIHRAAFEDGQNNGSGQFYSGFLHVCILAMGYRSADKTRPDMIRISMPNRESILHREAKFMLDYEIEQPAGIPSIGALLLLGDLECGVGRDNVGWLYAGMANRLCFDIGLHLDRSNTGLSQREIEIGRMVLKACVIYDKYWALFLGRPTSLKSSDLEIYNLSQQFERLGEILPAGPEKSLETRIYESLLDLMEIAGKITEIMDQASKLDDNVNVNHHVFVRMANLNRELEIWYTRLPKQLQWTQENVQAAPFSFFLLHQQYHVTMILLHRPFAKYGDSQPTASTESNDGEYSAQPNMHLSSMSRTICTQHAVRVARIFWQHRQRFDTKKIFVTGMQHAGTAAIALVAALASLKDSSSRDANLHYLEGLAAALQDMVEAYHPAERMYAVLEAVIVELRATLPQKRPPKVVPARRESSHEEGTGQYQPSKRHQSFRASPPRSSSFNQDKANPSMQREEIMNNPLIGEMSASSSTDRDLQQTRARDRASADEFVIVTPQTNSEGSWPSINKTAQGSLEYPIFTNPTRSTFANDPGQLRSAWMGAETPAVSPPANPFIFQTQSFQRSSADRIQDEAFGSNPSNLDFLSLLSTDRTDFPNLGGNDDFALLPTPTATPANVFSARPDSSTSSAPERRYTGQSRIQDGSAAQTMAGLDDLWAQMMRSDKKR